jgi:membrane protease YdiL (CAAX protease family)
MRRATAIVTILTLFMLPVAVLMTGVIPIVQRFWVLIVVVGSAVVVARSTRWSWRELGCRTDNVRAALVPYAIVAAIGVVVVITIASLSGRVVRSDWWFAPHFWGLFLPISIAQEFLYRSVLVPLLQRIHRAPWFVVSANATLFAFLHVLFPDLRFILPMTFFAGAVLTWTWLRWPNVWLASAVHVILNIVFTLFCFGGFETSCIHV